MARDGWEAFAVCVQDRSALSALAETGTTIARGHRVPVDVVLDTLRAKRPPGDCQDDVSAEGEDVLTQVESGLLGPGEGPLAARDHDPPSATNPLGPFDAQLRSGTGAAHPQGAVHEDHLAQHHHALLEVGLERLGVEEPGRRRAGQRRAGHQHCSKRQRHRRRSRPRPEEPVKGCAMHPSRVKAP